MKLISLDIKHWSRFERIWLFLFLGIIISSTVYFSLEGTDYNKLESILLNWIISPMSAISGIFCVVLAAKGKLSNWLYGIINCFLYGYLSYRSGYYGDAIINIIYFLPTQFIGLMFWKSRLKAGSDQDVIMRKLSFKQAIVIVAISLLVAIIFGIFLHYVDHWFTDVMKRNVSIYGYFESILGGGALLFGPIMDATTEVTQILAQILMIFAFVEQWIFWIITNIITIIMWLFVIISDPTSISWVLPILVMWIAYLVNSIYGWTSWKRGALLD